MPDLTDFLLARISDDRTYALSSHNHWTNCEAPNGEDCTCIATLGKRNRRRLAECESKRRIVEEHPEHNEWGHKCTETPCATLRLLALPYADHPQFDESWRVE